MLATSAPNPQPVTRQRRRRIVATAATLLAVPSLVLAAPGLSSAATTSHNRADAAAGWLGRQLPNGVVVGAFGPDYGLTADAVLALDAAGVGRRRANGATGVLEAHVLDYTGGGKTTEFYAGSFAKLLNVAAAEGIKPNRFGTATRHKLAFQLRRLECRTPSRSCVATDRGRFSDRSAFGDFSNTITQSLALIGLERTTHAGPSTAATVYLRHQQCRTGAFPLEISTPGCTPSVDATAFAVQALSEAGGGKAGKAAVNAGRWLKQVQHKDGSFTGNGTRNSNTTGLAAQALRAIGRDTAADRAVQFVRSLQLRCGAKPANRGKVRYDAANSGDALRATAQAVPAMAGVSLADITDDGARRGLPELAC